MGVTERVPAVRAWSPPKLRPVFHLIGGMLAALGALMLLPAVADALVGDADWQAFAASSALTLACGAGLLRATHCHLAGGLTIRQAFALTPLSWLAISAFAAVPLYLSSHGSLAGSWTNAFFEAISGLTTTGA